MLRAVFFDEMKIIILGTFDRSSIDRSIDGIENNIDTFEF